MLSNVFTSIAFPLSDGKEMKSVAESNLFTPDQFKSYVGIAEKGRGNAIVRYGGLGRPFPVYFPFRGKPNQIVSDSAVESAKQPFLEKYQVYEPMPTRPVPKNSEKKTVKIPANARKVLEALKIDPFLKMRQLMDAAGLTGKPWTTAKNWLEKNEYVIQHQIKVNQRGKPATFLDLTQKAYKALGMKRPNWGEESFKHRLFKDLTAQKFVEFYYGVYPEEFTLVEGSHHKFDLLCVHDIHDADYSKDPANNKANAVEITLSFDNLCENIVKAFQDERIEKLIIVTEAEKQRKKAKEIANDLVHDFGERIEFWTMQEVMRL